MCLFSLVFCFASLFSIDLRRDIRQLFYAIPWLVRPSVPAGAASAVLLPGCFSPPARLGLLDFMSDALLLLLPCQTSSASS